MRAPTVLVCGRAPVVIGMSLVFASLLGCGKHTTVATPGDAQPRPESSTKGDAAAETPHVDAGSTIAEPTSTPFKCSDRLLVAGRSWVEERTSTETARGTAGYVGHVWEGAKKTERRIEKKILAASADAVTRMRVKFLVDRDNRDDSDEPMTAPRDTPWSGQTFLVESTGAGAARALGEDGKALDEAQSEPVLAVVPEMTKPRWGGDAPALTVRLRTLLDWTEKDPFSGDQPNEGKSWGKPVATAAPSKKTRYEAARVFIVAGNANNAFVGMGHSGDIRIHVSGSIVIGSDGALLESQLTTRDVTRERTNFGCGPQQAAPCPWTTSATITKVESFQVQCVP